MPAKTSWKRGLTTPAYAILPTSIPQFLPLRVEAVRAFTLIFARGKGRGFRRTDDNIGKKSPCMGKGENFFRCCHGIVQSRSLSASREENRSNVPLPLALGRPYVKGRVPHLVPPQRIPSSYLHHPEAVVLKRVAQGDVLQRRILKGVEFSTCNIIRGLVLRIKAWMDGRTLKTGKNIFAVEYFWKTPTKVAAPTSDIFSRKRLRGETRIILV